MSLPYIPLYVDDYEAATAHLTIEEDGAYNRLLRLCWRTPGCSVPDDPKWIMRRMRVSADDYYRVVEPLIDEFFTRGMGRVFSARLQREMDKSKALHDARSAAGRKGNEKRWHDPQKTKPLKNNNSGYRKAIAKQSHPEPEPEPYPDKNMGAHTAPPKTSRGSRLREDWVLPDEWLQDAVSKQWPESVVRAEAEKFRDHWSSVSGKAGVKLNWQATFRNWLRKAEEYNPKIRQVETGQSETARLWALMEERAKNES